MDPLTLHIDTIATINRPKCKALGAGGPRAHIWSRLLGSNDEVRAVKVKGHATLRDVEEVRTSHLFKRGNDYADIFAKKGADTHTSLLFGSPRQSLPVLPWPSKLRDGRQRSTSCSGSGAGATPGMPRQERGHGFRGRFSSGSGRRLLRQLQVRFPMGFPPSFPHAFRKTVISTHARSEGTACSWDEFSTLGGRAMDNAIIICAKRGAVYWERADALCRSCSEHPGGRTSLRKLRSGLFPNKRCAGWTKEDVRRPSLDEATTLVAQLEPCEAGLGRTVLGPTTPKKQRVAPQEAVLQHWERIAEATTTEDQALQHWDRFGQVCWRRTGSTISW